MLIKNVGITSYGVALPKWKLLATQVEAAQSREVAVGDDLVASSSAALSPAQSVAGSLGIVSKTVPGFDEDTITLATQAGLAALAGRQDRSQIGALFIGSESHPYAVKPSGTVVKNALGLSDDLALADLQFACKAATQGWQIGLSYLMAGLTEAALVIGADTAQAKVGDVLEFTAGAGAAAYLLGREKLSRKTGKKAQTTLLARFLATTSLATDTPDFWRRPGQSYPEHAGRFSGEPGYFYHLATNAQKILAETGLQPSDFDYCVFHTPNGKFPRLIAQRLGFNAKQLEPSLLVEEIGNTYAAAVPLALSAVLDQAGPKEKILVVSYGSGAGSDAFVLETTELLPLFNRQPRDTVRKQIKALQEIKYQLYSQSRQLLAD